MRKVYLILNTIFIIAIVMLLDAYANSIESSDDSSSKRTQNRKRVKKIRKKRRVKVVIPDENLVAALNNSNLFEVNRGEEIVAATAKTPKRNNSSFKLMGVCHFGKLKGAIITSSSKSKTSSGKSYFTIGEEVGDGYKLYEVTAKAVVLKNGSRKINLELAKADNKPVRPTRTTPRRSSRRRSSRTRK